MDITKFGDETAQAIGQWHTFDADDGSSFDLCVAAANNKNFRDKQTKLLQAAAKRNKGKPITAVEYPDIVLRASLGTVLTGWRGLSSGGADVPFTEDFAFTLLNRRTLEIEALRRFIDSKSVDAELFAAEVKAADAAVFPVGDQVVP